ncbi:hypothetical protein E6P78_17010 [Streptomyces sp. A0958]|uniref:hypothetical protein n=1 Tax=Streptomyces sp. A0958 TaxID=2563101 RepID=UPI00109EC4B9|nr:hypothetical protein [Streptomyces sp. A0958]THA66065.1 hypothetical protein E6P78_17010 [Streptomyces sp. A0958]
MYAPGHPPTAPRRVPGRAWIVSMRVLFTVLSVFSLGLLLWTPLLRLAIVRRRAFDWWLTAAGFVFVCVLLPIIGRDGPEGAHGIDDVLIPLLLLAMLGAPAYYLAADIRHYARLTGRGGPAIPHATPGYGYMTTVPVPTPAHGLTGGTPQPYPPHPHQQPRPLPPTRFPQPQPQPQQQHPVPQQQHHPVPQPHPVPQQQHPVPQPHPQRIDQVRAELDELSDYLRKEEGR